MSVTPTPAGDSRPDWMIETDPDGLNVPGIDNAEEIAAQVAAAMQQAGGRAEFTGLGDDPHGREIFNPEGGSAPHTPESTDAKPPAAASTQDPAHLSPEEAIPGLGATTEQPAATDPAQLTTQPAADPNSATPPPVPEGHMRVNVGGQDYDISHEQAAYLLQVNTWLEGQPQEVKDQWAAIQNGTHQTISNEELEALQRAAAFQQQTPVQQQQQLVAEPDLELLDEATVRYIQHLKAQAATAQPTVDAPPVPTQQSYQQAGNIQPSPSPYDEATYRAATAHAEKMANNRAILDETIATYTERYNLDPTQVQRLQQVVADSGVVPVLSQRYATVSPTGQVIADAPFERVLDEAFTHAMVTDGTLRGVYEERVYNERLAAANTAEMAAKKGKAGSLAASPSAAVPATNTPTRFVGDNNQLNLPALTDAVAAAIASAEEAG